MAGMIVSDHKRSQQRLTRLARHLGVHLSDQPDPLQQFLVSQLASYSAGLSTGRATGNQTPADPNKTNAGDMGSEGGKKGSNGSRAPAPSAGTTSSRPTTVSTLRGFYLRLQAATHQQAIQTYSTIAISTHTSSVRAFACQSLPVLRRHLATVERALGSAQPGSTAGGSKALETKAARACASPGTGG